MAGEADQMSDDDYIEFGGPVQPPEPKPSLIVFVFVLILALAALAVAIVVVVGKSIGAI
jgi:hypothetical protein